MDLGGDLSIIEPSVAFQIMSFAGLTGELKLVTADNVASFYFKEGGLIYATIDTRRKKLGRFLIEKGWITEEQLNKVLREYAPKEKYGRIGHALIARGYLDYNSLASAIQEQMKEVVYEVLSWKKGQFIFFKGILPQDEDILLDVKLDHLILEGLKRLDEAKDPQ
ncbi:MAG: DUF4388 domain-containing protein [Candidatus Krumholzibacteria bacterium]|nr:DUF4388 domain-containing protein [Candidatus Krumholzibacteria bacterium]